ncbi:Epsin-2 [Labeo rohita]|uniref:Epsin-2 n=1 Tax=Labeo rohita TaxID=84645 RepID=A0ABQ8MYZ7_LABRO|nr:Epsin-2 [Labeo rohita]
MKVCRVAEQMSPLRSHSSVTRPGLTHTVLQSCCVCCFLLVATADEPALAVVGVTVCRRPEIRPLAHTLAVAMTTSALRRQVKNIVHNYSDAEIKVREATSNDPWGPSSSLMSEIAELTFSVVAFSEVMAMVWKRLNDHGKNWRHVYKALTLLDYLAKTGSERVAQQCRENAFTIQTLRDFQYVDRDGRDQGVNVREKAKQLVALLRDEERLRQERAQALKTKERMAGGGGVSGVPPAYPSRRSSQPSMAALYGEEFNHSRGSPSSFNSSSSSPRASDLEQTRPQTSGEEELQLQLALAMSREVFSYCGVSVSFHSQHAAARVFPSLNPHGIFAFPQDVAEVQKPHVLLKITLINPNPPQRSAPIHGRTSCISAQVSEEPMRVFKEQRSRQGDDPHLQKALEDSKKERDSRPSESAMIDLVDIFGPTPAVPASDDPWDAPPTCPVDSDPWESVAVVKSSNPVADSPWATRPSSSSPAHPWGTHQSPPDPWDATPSNSTSNMDEKAWRSPARPVSSVKDPFTIPEEEELRVEEEEEPIVEKAGPNQVFSPRCESPADADQFGELVVGVQVNGRGNDSPETFDLSRLGPPLDAVTPRQCRTPEAFLGPTAASLVNLDTLIPSNPPVKSKNPFLSGLSTPSPTNPFHCEQPRLTLNQMRPHSTSPLPAHALSYSASLPLPVVQQKPQTIPSSFTQPSHGLLDMPSNLPQPLLPLTPSTRQTEHPGQSHNPFL